MNRIEEKTSGIRKRQLAISVLVILLILAIGSYAFLYYSHAYRPDPRMEINADNSYSRTLHVVTDIDYEPFSYVDENGEYAGLDVELMNEIANRLQMNLDLKLMDWSEANQALLSGDADLIMNMETDLVTEESGLAATIPTTEKQYVVYGRQSISSVAELYGERVASLHHFPQLALGDSLQYVESYAAMFEGLKNAEYDYVVCPIQVGNSFLEKLNIKNVYPSYAVGHVYGALVAQESNKALCDQINPVIRDLQEEGFLDSLDRKWVNHHYENASVSSVIENHPGFAMILLGGLLLLVVMSLLYIAAQSRSARIKATYTKQLQDNLEILRAARIKAYQDELTGVRNKNAFAELQEEIQLTIDHGTQEPFAIAVCDVNGLKEVNDKKGHQAGDEYIREACRLICRIYDHSPVFRIGGDEFVVVLRGEDYKNRETLLADTRAEVLKNQDEDKVIVAIGMSDYAGDKTVKAVFERADKLMYQNKTTLKGMRH